MDDYYQDGVTENGENGRDGLLDSDWERQQRKVGQLLSELAV